VAAVPGDISPTPLKKNLKIIGKTTLLKNNYESSTENIYQLLHAVGIEFSSHNIELNS
jgi:hypothetical protein